MKAMVVVRTVMMGALLFAPVAAFAQGAPQNAQQGQILNMRDADIRAFINDVSMMTGRTFVVDPRVQGKVTVISQEPIAPEDVFEVFLSTLRVNGFTALPTANGAFRIVPEENAAQDVSPVGSEGAGDQLVTEVIRLKYVDVNTALQLVQPIINRQGRVMSARGSNAIIVVDYASNVRRIRSVISELDRDSSVVRMVPLRNTAAGEMASAVTGLIQAQSDPSNPGGGISAVAMEGGNILMLRGQPDMLARLIPVIEELDSRNASESDTKVIALRHASAADLLPLLERVSAAFAGPSDPQNPGAPVRGRANIGIYPGTNALVINAPPDVQRQLEAVIAKLDVRRPQVLVEAIIVEVSDLAAKELGVQYVLAGGEGSNIPFTATSFPNASPNILAATGAVVIDRETSGEDSDALQDLQALAVDSLLGMQGFAGGFAGQSDNGTIFGVILNALQQDTGSNVLSTPSIMTMDNEPASILVGQEIPITTGETLGANNTNPFRTIERKDVGVKLEVKPQINEGDAIRLFIKQEVSSIAGPVSTSSSELVTNKRQVETTVIVDDGQIIVLGGLIEDDEQTSVNKVPLLGDIPVLGNLFKSEGRSKRRTNLMIFLRPTIVRNVADLRTVTDRKYNYIQGEQVLRSRAGESSMDQLMQNLIGRAP